VKIVKFEGATMRDAVAKVKAELGDNAVIMATRQIRRGLLGTGYEISAAIEDHDDGGPRPTVKPYAHQAPAPVAQAPIVPPNRGEDLERVLAPMRTELRSLRALIRAADRPDTELRNELVQLRKLVEAGAAHAAKAETTAKPAAAAARTRAASDAALTAPSNARAIMLVGPTGVGKTTTIAKLAARAALVDGKRVELVTLDDYRVGGVDQIRTFADLIGIPLRTVSASGPTGGAAGLAEALATDADLVLIDTAGRSPRDTAAIAELATMIEDVPAIEVHVAISAGTSPAQIDKIVALYRPLAPARLLFTKLDEVDAAPELAEAPVRLRLPITWITTGQQVPEDLEEPTANRVLELANAGLPVMRAGRAA
jgi:flagellar biosynthesis protein FlhF